MVVRGKRARALIVSTIHLSLITSHNRFMQIAPQSSIDLPGIPRLRSGKVREVFDLGETLLFVATDRLSAFDVILPDPIPGKGAVLNQISAFWFRHFRDIENHLITEDYQKFPESLRRFED